MSPGQSDAKLRQEKGLDETPAVVSFGNPTIMALEGFRLVALRPSLSRSLPLSVLLVEQ